MIEILFLIAFTLHNLEEAIWLPNWSKNAGRYHKEVSKKQFIFTVSIITLFGYLITAQYLFIWVNSEISRYLYIGFVSMMLMNVIFPHFILTCILRRYAPGLLSGILIILPLGITILYKFLDSGINLLYLVLSTVILSTIFIVLIKIFLFIGDKIFNNENLEFLKAKSKDFNKLVNIRIRAMKPSLEKVGRFDVRRATERFQKSFIPENTTIVKRDGNVLGFYMVTEKDSKLFLNHLYVDPKFQSSGIGTILINKVKSRASSNNKIVFLEALKESPSNNFYISNGFIKIDESEFDNIYKWEESL